MDSFVFIFLFLVSSLSVKVLSVSISRVLFFSLRKIFRNISEDRRKDTSTLDDVFRVLNTLTGIRSNDLLFLKLRLLREKTLSSILLVPKR